MGDKISSKISSFLNYDLLPNKFLSKSAVPICYLLQAYEYAIKKFWSMRGWSNHFHKLYSSSLNDDQPPHKISSQLDECKLSDRVTRNVKSLSRFTFFRSLRSLAQPIKNDTFFVFKWMSKSVVQ